MLIETAAGASGMTCSRCQHENPPGSNFCLGCGARLGLTCSSCRTDLPPGSRFCNKCGTPVTTEPVASRVPSPDSYTPKHLAEKILTSKAALEGERKQVTVLFADLKGSMELLADLQFDLADRVAGTFDPGLELLMLWIGGLGISGHADVDSDPLRLQHW